MQYHDRRRKNIDYVDSELGFFLNLLGENSTKIFMSDHGHFLKRETRSYTKDATHVVMSVMGKGVPVKHYSKLFSLTNFLNLLIFLLNPSAENEDAMFSDEIWINVVDIYDKFRIQKYIEFGIAELGVACCGILTGTDRYVKLGTGKELYNIFPDEATNYINDPQYQQRIDLLREHAGNRFVDINRNEKFRYSHLLYDALKEKHVSD